MREQSELLIRFRSPTSHPTTKTSSTDAVTPTPQHNGIPASATSSAVTCSANSMPCPISSTLPASVPKAPRAMIQNQSTPTKPYRLNRRVSHFDSPTRKLSPQVEVSRISLDTTPKPFIATKPPAITVPPVIIADHSCERDVRCCWSCGQIGHDTMDCLNNCGHCGQKGHRTIDCIYRTLEDGKVVLDAEVSSRWEAKVKSTKHASVHVEIPTAPRNPIRRRDDGHSSQRSNKESKDSKRRHRKSSADKYSRYKDIDNRAAAESPPKERINRYGGGMASQSPWKEREERCRERDYSSGRYKERWITSFGRVRDKHSGQDVTIKKSGAIGDEREAQSGRSRREEADGETSTPSVLRHNTRNFMFKAR